jgi:hypothetical protein
MKREIYFFIGLIIFFAAACGDDEETPLSERVLGTWTAIENVTSNCDDTLDIGTITISCDSLDCYKLIITDSLLTEFRIVNGDTSTTDKVWHLVGDLVEICDSDAPDATCNDRNITVGDNKLRLIAPTDEDGCDFAEVFQKS